MSPVAIRFTPEQVAVAPEHRSLVYVVPTRKLIGRQRREDAVHKNVAWQRLNFLKGGTFEPLQVARDGEGSYVVLDGHHRLWAAQDLGMTHLPVMFAASGGAPKTELELHEVIRKTCIRCGRPLVEGRWITTDHGPVCLPGEPPEGQQACEPKGGEDRQGDTASKVEPHEKKLGKRKPEVERSDFVAQAKKAGFSEEEAIRAYEVLTEKMDGWLWSSSKPAGEFKDSVRRMLEGGEPQNDLDRAVRVAHAMTQEALKQAGVDEVTLYRGFRDVGIGQPGTIRPLFRFSKELHGAKQAGAKEIEFPVHAATAWSLDKGVAEAFAEVARYGYVVKTTVPRSRVVLWNAVVPSMFRNAEWRVSPGVSSAPKWSVRGRVIRGLRQREMIVGSTEPYMRIKVDDITSTGVATWKPSPAESQEAERKKEDVVRIDVPLDDDWLRRFPEDEKPKPEERPEKRKVPESLRRRIREVVMQDGR